MKAYVIVRIGYEYNDEIYYSHDRSGHPTLVFFSKQSAHEKVRELNAVEFKSTNISEYYYEISEVCDDLDELQLFVDDLNSKYGKPQPVSSWDRPDEWRLHNDATVEESKKYCDMVKISFFEVIETQVDRQDLIDSQITSILD